MPDKKLMDDLNRRMEGALNAFHHDLRGLRTGRANVALLDGIAVDAYGSKMPIDQIATVNAAEARLLTVQVWDVTNVAAVRKAIENANLGLNPSAEGNLIRVPLPDLSEERRKEMVKIVHQYIEKARIAIRNVRRDGMDAIKKMEKDGDIPQDDMHKLSDEIQKLTDDFVKKVEEDGVHKEKEIMVV
jgi:ribosome recycling factor